MNVANELKASTVRRRAVIIALLLIVPNAYFVIGAEVLSNQGFPTRVALFYTVVFIIFVVTLLNTILQKVPPQRSLNSTGIGFPLRPTFLRCVSCRHRYATGTHDNDWTPILVRHA